MKTILVVDDFQDGLDWMQETLEKKGYLITTCTNAQDALREIKVKSFDLIISDIVMTVMDGLQLLQRIRELQKKGKVDKLGVIMITAASNEDRAIMALNLGAYAYILKDDNPYVELPKAVDKYFTENVIEDQVIKAMESLIKNSPDPDKKFFASGGKTLSSNQMLEHLRAGDDLGQRIRKSILSVSVELLSR